MRASRLLSDRALAVASEILANGVLGDAESARKQGFSHVVPIQRGDVLLIGEGDGLLSLDDLDIIRDAGAEPVARLGQLLRREIAAFRRNVELLAGGFQVEKGRAD